MAQQWCGAAGGKQHRDFSTQGGATADPITLKVLFSPLSMVVGPRFPASMESMIACRQRWAGGRLVRRSGQWRGGVGSRRMCSRFWFSGVDLVSKIFADRKHVPQGAKTAAQARIPHGSLEVVETPGGVESRHLGKKTSYDAGTHTRHTYYTQTALSGPARAAAARPPAAPAAAPPAACPP